MWNQVRLAEAARRPVSLHGMGHLHDANFRLGRRRFLGLAAAGAAGALLRPPRIGALQPPRVNADRLNLTLAELARVGRDELCGVMRVVYGDADLATRALV